MASVLPLTFPHVLSETMVAAVQKVAPEINLTPGMDEQMGEFSPGSKDVLSYISGNLKTLLTMTDEEMTTCYKVDQWLPEAARLYGELEEN